MIRPQPRSTRTDTLFPYTTLFRSVALTPVVPPAGGKAQYRHLRSSRSTALPLRFAKIDSAPGSVAPHLERIVNGERDMKNKWPPLEDRKSTRLNSSH